MWMFLLLPVSVPLHGTVVIPSGTSWPFVLPSQHKKASVLSWELLALACDSPTGRFRWQKQVNLLDSGDRSRGRAQTGSVPTSHGWGPNLCPQLLYISTPGLELCCIITVFKENCWIRWFTALPIWWACQPLPPAPPLGYTLPTQGAA